MLSFIFVVHRLLMNINAPFRTRPTTFRHQTNLHLRTDLCQKIMAISEARLIAAGADVSVAMTDVSSGERTLSIGKK